jgi:hypothetical protein
MKSKLLEGGIMSASQQGNDHSFIGGHLGAAWGGQFSRHIQIWYIPAEEMGGKDWKEYFYGHQG